MKEFLEKLGLTPKKAIIYGSILFAILALYITVMILLSAGEYAYDGSGNPVAVPVLIDGTEQYIHLFQNYFNAALAMIGRILFSAIFGITIITVAVVYLIKYLLNTGKIKSDKFVLPLNITLTSILFVLFVAVTVVSILIMTGNFIIPQPGGDLIDGQVRMADIREVLNGFFDPQIKDFTGRPVPITVDWSSWYYWVYWTLVPLMGSLFIGFVMAGVFGILLPVLNKKRAKQAV